MRIGLAGVGRIGSFHAETLRSIPEIDSIVLADADPSRAKAVAARLGVEAIDAPWDLFTAGLDGLVIAAATDQHAALLLASVEAGITAFCEKPIALDVEGTLAVLNKVADADVAVHVGFQRRFDAGYRAAREAVASGRLGWLHTLRAGTLDPAPPTPEYVATSGGMFRDCSVHDFDCIRWVTGREVVEVYATGANHGAQFFAAVGDVDAASALLTLDDGTSAHVSASRYNAAGYDVRLEALGSSGSVAVGLDNRVPLHSVEPGVDWPTGTPHLTFMERFREAYIAELAAFVDLVAGQRVSPCTVADALEAFYIAEACERSRAEHRPVRVEEVRR